jgi:hypothetical protein
MISTTPLGSYAIVERDPNSASRVPTRFGFIHRRRCRMACRACRGTARANGRVLFRGIDDVAFADVADGEHSVVVVARGRVVAFGVIPRDELAPPK